MYYELIRSFWINVMRSWSFISDESAWLWIIILMATSRIIARVWVSVFSSAIMALTWSSVIVVFLVCVRWVMLAYSLEEALI